MRAFEFKYGKQATYEDTSGTIAHPKQINKIEILEINFENVKFTNSKFKKLKITNQKWPF